MEQLEGEALYGQKGSEKMEERRERFIPDRELETVEIDVKNKKLRVNGREFGKDATAFSLSCNALQDTDKWWEVTLRIATDVTYFASYDIDGKITSSEERHPKESDATNN
ncbi:MAG: hypothetical protein NC489_25565 [Ruminococcus flavefaciens]|nr:hypothetical protein [Ruminococcus flavefaciens]